MPGQFTFAWANITNLWESVSMYKSYFIMLQNQEKPLSKLSQRGEEPAFEQVSERDIYGVYVDKPLYAHAWPHSSCLYVLLHSEEGMLLKNRM